MIRRLIANGLKRKKIEYGSTTPIAKIAVTDNATSYYETLI